MHLFPNLANTVKIEGSFSLAAQVRLVAPINYGIQSSTLQNHVPRLWFLSLRHRKTWAVSEHRRRTRSFAWWYPRCGIPKAVSLHHSLIWIILHQASARTRMRLKFQGYQWNQWTNCENGVQVFNRTVACALMWSKTQIKASGWLNLSIPTPRAWRQNPCLAPISWMEWAEWADWSGDRTLRHHHEARVCSAPRLMNFMHPSQMSFSHRGPVCLKKSANLFGTWTGATDITSGFFRFKQGSQLSLHLRGTLQCDTVASGLQQSWNNTRTPKNPLPDTASMLALDFCTASKQTFI